MKDGQFSTWKDKLPKNPRGAELLRAKHQQDEPRSSSGSVLAGRTFTCSRLTFQYQDANLLPVRDLAFTTEMRTDSSVGSLFERLCSSDELVTVARKWYACVNLVSLGNQPCRR